MVKQYNARNFAAVKLVTKASQWREIGTRRRRGRGVIQLRITSFAGNSERQSFVRCTVPSHHRVELYFHYTIREILNDIPRSKVRIAFSKLELNSYWCRKQIESV
ncbi:hypothetical protein EVAR_81380_1 [Eumeta japonica]|uniref:Uncharacterized protein n=1 Tax=Eumeta variegata TaxID=151549 RepID=A0A4C1WF47_EUMVA|nr:hypothetical protein EVAR_81380_1 [Eumeta japonica]